jgi:hypothetical protein
LTKSDNKKAALLLVRTTERLVPDAPHDGTAAPDQAAADPALAEPANRAIIR